MAWRSTCCCSHLQQHVGAAKLEGARIVYSPCINGKQRGPNRVCQLCGLQHVLHVLVQPAGSCGDLKRSVCHLAVLGLILLLLLLWRSCRLCNFKL